MSRAERILVWRQVRKFYEVGDAHKWMESPHPQLDNRRPCDCTYDEVMVIIDRLKSGAFL